MPITVKHDVPKSLDVLLALQSGGAVGAAERGKEERTAARKAVGMRQEMLFKAAQEEFHARQQAYRQQLNSQQEMQQQMMRGQEQMQAQQAQREWESQATQRATEQLQQQRKANRDSFLNGQMGLGEYQQADAAFAARMAGLDPNAQEKERQGLLEEFPKRADPKDKSLLQGINSKRSQLRRGIATGRYGADAARGAMANLDEEERVLLEDVQSKPDKSGPPLVDRVAEGMVTSKAVFDKLGLAPDDPVRAAFKDIPFRMIVRNGVASPDPIFPKPTPEDQLNLEQVKQEGALKKAEVGLQQKEKLAEDKRQLALQEADRKHEFDIMQKAAKRWSDDQKEVDKLWEEHRKAQAEGQGLPEPNQVPMTFEDAVAMERRLAGPAPSLWMQQHPQAAPGQPAPQQPPVQQGQAFLRISPDGKFGWTGTEWVPIGAQ